MQQTHYLVVTAIGTDRTGIVGDLTRLVNDCSCNILDSHMAIFGQEFAFIMMLSGDRQSIAKAENTLPSTSHELGLLTMMKRTSRPKSLNGDNHQDNDTTLVIEYVGPDIPGTLNAVTEFLAQQGVAISSLKTNAFLDNSDDTSKHATWITFKLTSDTYVKE
jgi:glycine cleavage system transcriptional repressor